MPERHHSKVLIIGSGPAGYTAAIYAARANLEPLLVTGLQPGGQMTITTRCRELSRLRRDDPGPVADGADAETGRARRHASDRRHDHAIDLRHRPFVATGDSGDSYVGETVIIATGAQARWLGLPSEELFRGLGVSACATCDGFFFRGKDVAVVGGGNTAVEEALYLTNHARQRHPDPSPRRAAGGEDPAGAAVPQSEDQGGLGHAWWRRSWATRAAQGSPGVRLRNVKTGGVARARLRRRVRCHRPYAGDRVRRRAAADGSGGLHHHPPGITETAIAGVFAAGDVKDKVFRQAVTAAGMGCMAALEAEKFLGGRRGQLRACARPSSGATANLEPLAGGNGMDWDKLRVFHAVAEAGSFTHAGESLNLSQSAVSRQICALEESLSVPLFHRHARGLILTEQGELLYRTAREVFAKLSMAEGLISEARTGQRGR